MPNIIRWVFIGYTITAIFYTAYLVFQREILNTISNSLLMASLAIHTFALLNRWRLSGHIPLASLYESMILFAWLIVAVSLVVKFPYTLRILRLFTILAVLLVLSYAFRLNTRVRPLMPALQSYWLPIHVLTNLIAYSFFVLSFISSVTYLVVSKNLISSDSSLTSDLDSLNYRTIFWGVLFLALGIITGSVWAEQAWGSYWSWDPKETWALVTWLIYVLYLHGRFALRWSGGRRAWLAVAGFFSVVFTYIGVSLLPGLH